ncbi:MAG: hypothetical protein AB1486_25355 [Planctomycetota bacterium]
MVAQLLATCLGLPFLPELLLPGGDPPPQEPNVHLANMLLMASDEASIWPDNERKADRLHEIDLHLRRNGLMFLSDRCSPIRTAVYERLP